MSSSRSGKSPMRYDLLIIGSDPASRALGFLAHRLDLRVAEAFPVPGATGRGSAVAAPARQDEGPSPIERWCGHVSFVGPHRVRVERDGAELVLHAHHIVVATGSRATRPGWIDFDAHRVVTVDDCADDPEGQCDPVAIVGAGTAGLAVATQFAKQGTPAVLLEQRRSVFEEFDRELINELFCSLRQSDIDIRLGQEVIAVEQNGQSV
ncbi:MAG TPA: hypothetical protein EYP14_19665, partial [Planctomycetaceae bacterium]|nr:hypothetical protein [Planctomycetaceae bacterium]